MVRQRPKFRRNSIVDMAWFVKEVMAEVKSKKYSADEMHWAICQMMCAEYDIWEIDPADGKASCPLWVIYVVDGIMKDNGINEGNDRG